MQELVCGREKIYFVISVFFSLLIYLVLIISVIGIVYLLIGSVIGFILHGLFMGSLKGNGVKVSEKQFSEVYFLAEKHAKAMGLESLPAIYILQAGGALNAFTTKFLSRNFIILYSDIFEIAYEKGESALSFIICHELAHIKRKHLTMRWFLYPTMFIPFLGTAYSRACETTCDRFGAYYEAEGAIPGLLVLAAGKNLYNKVNLEELNSQEEQEKGFWVWLAEILSTHPNLTKRIKLINNFKMIRSATAYNSGLPI
jgi:Zn-dependent protease with chaperone function